MTQLAFDLTRPRQTPEQDAAQLTRFLAERPDWFNARAIRDALTMTERQIRQAAETACPEVISGQLGYKHVKHASTPEIEHFVNWMISQARKMAKRAMEVKHRAEQR